MSCRTFCFVGTPSLQTTIHEWYYSEIKAIRMHEITNSKSYLILCLRLQVLRKITRRSRDKGGSGKWHLRIIYRFVRYVYKLAGLSSTSIEFSTILTTLRRANLAEYSSSFFGLAVRRQSSIQSLVPRGSVLPDKGLDVRLIENACVFNTNY